MGAPLPSRRVGAAAKLREWLVQVKEKEESMPFASSVDVKETASGSIPTPPVEKQMGELRF